MINTHRTMKGRVVYNRKKHTFTVKRAGNIIATLSNQDKGNMVEWQYITKVAEMNWRGRAAQEGRISSFAAQIRRMRPCDPRIKSLYEFFAAFNTILNEAEKWLSWLPWVGAVLQIGNAFWQAIWDNIGVEVREKWMNCQAGVAEEEQEEEQEIEMNPETGEIIMEGDTSAWK